MTKNKKFGSAKIISIEEPHPEMKFKNRYAIAVAKLDSNDCVGFGTYPVLSAVKEILKDYRAYSISYEIMGGSVKYHVSKLSGKNIEKSFDWILAFDKKSEESESEKQIAQGIISDEDKKSFPQKCSIYVKVMKSKDMDNEALLIISSKKIGSKLKSILEMHDAEAPLLESSFDNFFDFEGVGKKLKKEGIR